MQNIVKPERPGGFLDFLPADYLAREKILKTIEDVFQSFGFDPIETPRIEFLKTLSGETSDTGKNIFHIKSTLDKNTQDDEPLALAFDHTVPFARILAANPYDSQKRTGIRLPWRRMVVGPVFRSDTPQSGRYRQFYQFDADIAGTTSMIADAEIVTIMYQTMKKLGIDNFKIKLNNRKILNGLAHISNISERKDVSKEDITKQMMRILDKLDKIGLDKVKNELKASPENSFDPSPCLSDNAVDKIISFISIKGNNEEKLDQCKNIFKDIVIAQEGINELYEILEYIKFMGTPVEFVEIDFSIARGLDYYTGPVMETILLDAMNFGSVFSGGRYNDLVKRFTGKELPATGASIGVDRLFAALKFLNVIDQPSNTVSDLMILRLDKNYDADYIEMASELRQIGLNVEFCLLDDTTFKNQFNFAIIKGVKYVLIVGENEFKNKTVQIKNLHSRVQEEINRDNLVSYIKNII